MTPSSGVWPEDRVASPCAKAVPTGPSFSPTSRSTCASSYPFPTNASPIK